MNETFIDRLDLYKECAGLNDNQITVRSGLTVGILNSARKRGKGLSAENIEKVLNAFKDINARWLLTGEGNMMAEDECSPSNNESLTNYLAKENKDLKAQNEQLNRELGKLEGQIIELKKRAPEAGNVECAIASGSDLEM